jgi:hypothetical protein
LYQSVFESNISSPVKPWSCPRPHIPGKWPWWPHPCTGWAKDSARLSLAFLECLRIVEMDKI